MGNTNSLETYRNSLRQVADKTVWHEDLIVQIAGQKPLIVYHIKPLTHHHSADELTHLLHISTFINPGEQHFIYQYSGNRINAKKSPIGKYAVFMKTLDTGKIGGSRHDVSPLELPPSLLHRHGSVTPADILSDDILARTEPDFTGRAECLEDNIADE